jgi:regulator of sigma E protease
LEPQTTVVDPEKVEQAGKTRYEIGLFSAEMFVSRLIKDSPAEKIGIRAGDRLAKFDGQVVTSWIQVIEAMQAEPDKEHQVAWFPVGKPEVSATFKLLKKTSVDDYRNERTEYVFGADQRLLIKQVAPVEIKNRFTYALGRSVSETGKVIVGMTQALVYLFKGDIPSDSLGSVIMLAHAAKTAAQKGWDHFLAMMALISINLGILNLLPIPVLDGGHIMFFTIEAINRRPLSLRSREIASYVGLILLLSLMVFAIRNDVVRYLLRPGS